MSRGAEQGRRNVDPLVLEERDEPETERFVDQTRSVAVRLASADRGKLSVSDFDDLKLGAMTPEVAAANLSYFRRCAVQELLRGIEAPARFDKLAFVSACDEFTAAALLAEIPLLPKGSVIEDWIFEHPIIIGEIFAPPAKWRPRQGLARPPAVTDHFVVRQRLLGYEMGEIEDIKSYMLGERKEHRLRFLRVNEEESFRETEEETTRANETATEQRNAISLTAQNTADASMGLDARVQTEGQYGPTQVSTDVGFQYASAKSETRQAASEFSTNVVTRSAEEVRNRTLSRIMQRSRIELEENEAHSVDNTDGTGHTIGIYRWVESVWEARTYRLSPPRLILEFLIPEPARALLPEPVPDIPASVGPPPQPLPADLFNTLTAEKAAQLAATYGAEGIKAPPLSHQTIGVPFGGTEFKDEPPEHVSAIVVKELTIPEKYIGEAVVVAVTAMDRMDLDESNIVVDVPGARPTKFLDDPQGPSNPIFISGGPNVVGRSNAGLKTLMVSAKTNFGPGATVPVAVHLEDVRGATGFIEVFCRLTDEALNQWKLDTIQALTSAYRSRLAEWEAARLARSFDAADKPPDPDLDALCRHACIGSLIGTWPPAAGLSDAEGWPKPAALVGPRSDLVVFLEQAFEWRDLQYVAYPYYWAAADRWKKLLGVDHADPHVREFLRSGAVRMVVSVRPQFTEAVLFFLDTGLPWFGGSAAIPGEPGYLAIADEIRSARDGERKGELINTFNYRLPTSLTILQASGELPAPPPPA